MKAILKNKKIIIFCMISLAYYAVIALFQFVVSENYLLYPADYKLSKNCIIVEGQCTTGPEIHVIQGSEFLLEALEQPYPDDINVTEIKMTGRSIYDLLDYPDYYNFRFLVKGSVIGLTDEYRDMDSGTVPVFQAVEIYPITSLSKYLVTGSFLGLLFPFTLIAVVILWFWPIIVYIVLVRRLKLKALKQSTHMNEESILNTLLITDNNMAPAAEIIKAGGLVAVPTETVYGLAANGLDGDAVQKIYDVKGRPETKPISLLVSGMTDVEKFCRDIPDSARVLAEKFWPGPLTMVLYKSDTVPDIVTASGQTVGVRCPDHGKTLDLIRLAGVPLAAPSANMSGEPSPKNVNDVLKVFDGKIDAAIDGGQCTVGIESTIIDMTTNPPKILRQGGLPREAIEKALKTAVADPSST